MLLPVQLGESWSRQLVKAGLARSRKAKERRSAEPTPTEKSGTEGATTFVPRPSLVSGENVQRRKSRRRLEGLFEETTNWVEDVHQKAFVASSGCRLEAFYRAAVGGTGRQTWIPLAVTRR